jgi:hypothetical protein
LQRGTRRKREDSGSSLRSDDRNSNTPDSELSAPSISTRSNTPEVARPGKRKCSENASELIKACIGADDRRKSGLLGESAEIDKESNKKKMIEPRKSSETNRGIHAFTCYLLWVAAKICAYNFDLTFLQKNANSQVLKFSKACEE